jgi:hypothetical protein
MAPVKPEIPLVDEKEGAVKPPPLGRKSNFISIRIERDTQLEVKTSKPSFVTIFLS